MVRHVTAYFPNEDYPGGLRKIEGFCVSDNNLRIGHMYYSDAYAVSRNLKQKLRHSGAYAVWVEIVEMSEDKSEIWFDYINKDKTNE